MAVLSVWPPLANWDIHHEAAGAAGWVGPHRGGCFGDFLSIGKCESGPRFSISSAQYTFIRRYKCVLPRNADAKSPTVQRGCGREWTAGWAPNISTVGGTLWVKILSCLQPFPGASPWSAHVLCGPCILRVPSCPKCLRFGEQPRHDTGSTCVDKVSPGQQCWPGSCSHADMAWPTTDALWPHNHGQKAQ